MTDLSGQYLLADHIPIVSLTPITWESKANLHSTLQFHFRNWLRDCYIKSTLQFHFRNWLRDCYIKCTLQFHFRNWLRDCYIKCALQFHFRNWLRDCYIKCTLQFHFRNWLRDCYIKCTLKANFAAGSASNIRGCYRAKMFVPASSPLRLVTPAGSTEIEGKGIPFARHS